MKIVTAAQMTAIEQASERAGVSTDVLMENAGLAVAQEARDLVGAAGARALVLAGPGNHGPARLVAAQGTVGVAISPPVTHLRWMAGRTAAVTYGSTEAAKK